MIFNSNFQTASIRLFFFPLKFFYQRFVCAYRRNISASVDVIDGSGEGSAMQQQCHCQSDCYIDTMNGFWRLLRYTGICYYHIYMCFG